MHTYTHITCIYIHMNTIHTYTYNHTTQTHKHIQHTHIHTHHIHAHTYTHIYTHYTDINTYIAHTCITHTYITHTQTKRCTHRLTTATSQPLTICFISKQAPCGPGLLGIEVDLATVDLGMGPVLCPFFSF